MDGVATGVIYRGLLTWHLERRVSPSSWTEGSGTAVRIATGPEGQANIGIRRSPGIRPGIAESMMNSPREDGGCSACGMTMSTLIQTLRRAELFKPCRRSPVTAGLKARPPGRVGLAIATPAQVCQDSKREPVEERAQFRFPKFSALALLLVNPGAHPGSEIACKRELWSVGKLFIQRLSDCAE